MKSYLKKLAEIGTRENPGILLVAWNLLLKRTSLKQQEISCGVDSETILAFRKSFHKHLLEISERITSNEGYVFSGLKPIPIKKTNGKYRIICIPTVRDRIVQKGIQLALSNQKVTYTEFNGFNYGFVKNYGVRKALAKAIELRSQKQFVYKTDISAFFDNIERSILKQEIQRKIHIPSLLPIIFNAVDSEIINTDKGTEKRIFAAGITHGRGVRQGMPLSPLFANLYLSDLDKFCIKKGINGVRYADDMVFFAKSRDECLLIDGIIRNELRKINLNIPSLEERTKTRIYEPTQVVEFLGMGIVEREGSYCLIIPDDQQEEIKNSIFKFSDMNYLASRQLTYPQLLNSLEATIKGYLGVYLECENQEEFTRTMYQWKDRAVHDLMINNYGIDIFTLSKQQKYFLTGC